MNSNQEILDSTLKHRILLLGFSKQLAEEIIAYLKRSEPEIRALLLKQFSEGGFRLITRLRETEASLRAIRGEAWRQASEHAAIRLQQMADGESESLERILGQPFAKPSEQKLGKVVLASLIAGNTLAEWFDAMAAGDIRRSVAQLRISAMADEPIAKMSRRLTGRLSMISPAAYNGIRSLSATAVGVVSDEVRYLAAKNLYNLEIWVSVLDSRTTEGCRKLNDQILEVGVGPWPGYHMGCRSIRVPWFEGKVTKETKFTDFMSRQSDEFVRYVGSTTEFSLANLAPLTLSQVSNFT